MIEEDQIHRIPQQVVRLERLKHPGIVLDIGGGGEGTIGRLEPGRVVAIDRIEQELLDSPPGPVKIVMDARHMRFTPNVFECATAFFSLMYVHKQDRPKVYHEVHRVLKPGGVFYVWDAVIPKCPPQDLLMFYVVPLEVVAAEFRIQTGFGVRWEQSEQDFAQHVSMAEDAGFSMQHEATSEHLFHIVFKKPRSA